MKNIFIKALAGFGLGLFISGLTLSAQEPGQSLLWQIKSPTSEVSYLFGTYHLLGSDYLKHYPQLAQKWEDSQTTVVETVMDSSLMVQMAMKSMMTQHSLRDLVDSANYQLLIPIFEQLQIPETMAQRMKPVVINAAYAVQMAEENTPVNFNYGGTPIDVFFATQAIARGQELIALETMLEQMEMLFNSQSLEEQASDLVALAKEPHTGKEAIAQIITAYQQQNLQKMYELSLEHDEMGGDFDVLLHQRNAAWVKTLTPILNKGKAFIAVGALHLPGEGGLLQRLKKLGFAVKPIIYAN